MCQLACVVRCSKKLFGTQRRGLSILTARNAMPLLKDIADNDGMGFLQVEVIILFNAALPSYASKLSIATDRIPKWR